MASLIQFQQHSSGHGWYFEMNMNLVYADFGVAHFFFICFHLKKRKSKMLAQRCAWLYLAFFSQILQSYASKAAFNHLWFAAEIALKWFILNFVECADKRIHVPKPSCTIISIVLWLIFFQISNHAHSITFSGWIVFHTFKCALYPNSEISSGPGDAGLRLKLI